MRAIEVSEEVYQKLQAIAIPFQDTPSTVVERLLAQANGAARRPANPPIAPSLENPLATPTDDGSYTYKRPVAYTLDRQTHAVSSFKEVYLSLCREMATRHAESFDRVLTLRGRERIYFSASNSAMTHPRRIEGTNIFAETNFSAQNIMDRCRELLKLFGYQPSMFSVDVRPVGE